MTYTDAQGRPEIVMHPDIKRGTAPYRLDDDADEQVSALGRGTQPVDVDEDPYSSSHRE